MKKTKEILIKAIILLVIMLGSLVPTQALAKTNGWVSNGQGWSYYTNNQMVRNNWVKDSVGIWYFLGDDGVMKKDWIKNDGKWYFLNNNGAMLSNQWIKSGGKSYYLTKSGDMAVNTRTPDGFMVGADGAWDGKPIKPIELGQTVIIPNALFGTYEITINNVELSNDRNIFDNSNPAEVYKINYTYKLLEKGTETGTGLYLYNPFTAMDSNDEMGDKYPNITNNKPKKLILVGSSCTADTFIAMKNKTDYLFLSLPYFLDNSMAGLRYERFKVNCNNDISSTDNTKTNQSFNTKDDLQKYLNNNYYQLDTPMGKWNFKNTIYENDDSTFQYDYWIKTNWSGVNIYDIKHSIKYTEEEKGKTIQLLKDYQEKIANIAMSAFTDKKIRGGFYHGYYEYPYLEVGYKSIGFFSWNNYSRTSIIGDYYDSTITEFHWDNTYDDYEF